MATKADVLKTVISRLRKLIETVTTIKKVLNEEPEVKWLELNDKAKSLDSAILTKEIDLTLYPDKH